MSRDFCGGIRPPAIHMTASASNRGGLWPPAKPVFLSGLRQPANDPPSPIARLYKNHVFQFQFRPTPTGTLLHKFRFVIDFCLWRVTKSKPRSLHCRAPSMHNARQHQSHQPVLYLFTGIRRIKASWDIQGRVPEISRNFK